MTTNSTSTTATATTTAKNTKPKKKFKLKDLRPVVQIFGKEYRLPYLTSTISDKVLKEDARLALYEAIDSEYPGIRNPEQQMIYLHIINESRRTEFGGALENKTILIDGIEHKISIDDIKKFDSCVHESGGCIWRFREISALEYFKGPVKTPSRGILNKSSILDYCFQHVEIPTGEKLKFDEFEEDFPWELSETHVIDSIIGELYIEINGTLIKGLNAILDAFGVSR